MDLWDILIQYKEYKDWLIDRKWGELLYHALWLKGRGEELRYHALFDWKEGGGATVACTLWLTGSERSYCSTHSVIDRKGGGATVGCAMWLTGRGRSYCSTHFDIDRKGEELLYHVLCDWQEGGGATIACCGILWPNEWFVGVNFLLFFFLYNSVFNKWQMNPYDRSPAFGESLNDTLNITLHI